MFATGTDRIYLFKSLLYVCTLSPNHINFNLIFKISKNITVRWILWNVYKEEKSANIRENVNEEKEVQKIQENKHGAWFVSAIVLPFTPLWQWSIFKLQ